MEGMCAQRNAAAGTYAAAAAAGALGLIAAVHVVASPAASA